MLWTFVYLAVRNLFAPVGLLARPRRSKKFEILILRVGCTNSVVRRGSVSELVGS